MLSIPDRDLAAPPRSRPSKPERALTVLATEDCAMSGQVIAEFYFNATRETKLTLPHAVALEWIDDFRCFPIVPVTIDLVARGAMNAARCKISYWDGAIIAAAEENWCRHARQ